jgi:hypothetical protein
MYRFQRIAQILRLIPPPIPPLRRPWPTLASPVSLYILSQAQTARLGRIAIDIPQRSILIKSKKLRLCSSPHAFPTIQAVTQLCIFTLSLPFWRLILHMLFFQFILLSSFLQHSAALHRPSLKPIFVDDLLRLDFAFDLPIHVISNNRHMRISHSVKVRLN